MNLVEEIAQHLYQTSLKGNENSIYWTVRNEFVERSGDVPSDENIRTTVKRLKELSAQNKN